jgi:DNA invertase Pin-like site-specific DNA recombinase
MLVGYMRVSSDSDRQTRALQRDALLAAGVDERHLSGLGRRSQR